MADTLITGGRGTTGGFLAKELAGLGQPFRIATRAPRDPMDVAFDWHRPDIARAAFAGMDALYIVAPTDTVEHESVVLPRLEDALGQGVRRFVLLSASSLEPGGPMMGKIHSWLSMHAPEWAVLRPSWFMQNLSTQHRPAIRDEGAIYTATGDGRVGFIDAQDIARVAVEALTSAVSWNRDHILTGPQALNYAEVGAILGEELGRPIRHVAESRDAYARRLVAHGLEEIYAASLAEMDERIAAGSEDRTTDSVSRLTGRMPTDLRTYVRRHLADWQTA